MRAPADARQAVVGADALLIPPTAQALRVWRRLTLELGEAAIYTDGHPLAEFIGLVATWHGAHPVIRLTTSDAGAIDDVETVNVGDAQAAVERIRSLTASAAGLAAVDLSGRGNVLSALLEALPRWGRLMLAGPSPEPFTTAFYADVHRKGALVCAAGDLDTVFSDPAAWDLELRNARRLLADSTRAARLRACLTEDMVSMALASGSER
jgi:hypothetical protein